MWLTHMLLLSKTTLTSKYKSKEASKMYQMIMIAQTMKKVKNQRKEKKEKKVKKRVNLKFKVAKDHQQINKFISKIYPYPVNPKIFINNEMRNNLDYQIW